MLIYGAPIDRQPLGHRPRQEVRERGMGRDLDVWVLWQFVVGRGCVCVEAGYQVSLAPSLTLWSTQWTHVVLLKDEGRETKDESVMVANADECSIETWALEEAKRRLQAEGTLPEDDA